DFLIAPSARISAVKYGTDAYDQWSIDELLSLAKGVAAKALKDKHLPPPLYGLIEAHQDRLPCRD
ncbi:MAG TPA: hypothetical protein VM781_00375, partial [Candidatus Bathyarchaeia archaeon]|nr:hypothetical protein [Candidatus Bathyarchaeia archaeon]